MNNRTGYVSLVVNGFFAFAFGVSLVLNINASKRERLLRERIETQVEIIKDYQKSMKAVNDEVHEQARRIAMDEKNNKVSMLIETGTFNARFVPVIHTILINLRPRLVDSNLFFDQKLVAGRGSGSISESVANLVKKLLAIEGVRNVQFEPHRIEISFADMFKVEEFQQPILAILKAEFPEVVKPEEAKPSGTTSSPMHQLNPLPDLGVFGS